MQCDYEHIVDKSCEAWNFFADDKAAITSICVRRLFAMNGEGRRTVSTCRWID
jgi:hypothetical protein